jgi:hypothetical protein
MSLCTAAISRVHRLASWALLGTSLALAGCSGDGTSGAPAPTYSLGGTVSGLNSSGLALLVNGGAVSVAASATAQQFATSLSSGTTYSVTVQTQPSGETCSVAGGTGTIGSANVANVVVTCSDRAYALGGTISGLTTSGLVLVNGTDTLSVSSGATSFTLPALVAYTSSYTVTVKTQPSGLTCAVSHAMGTMPANAVTSVALTCTDQPFM